VSGSLLKIIAALGVGSTVYFRAEIVRDEGAVIRTIIEILPMPPK
jgi:hypothetical protein